MSKAAVLVDRDGVINRLVVDRCSGQPESPLAVSDVVLMEGAAQALRRIVDVGRRLVGVSNQPAAAKGTATLSEIYDVQARVLELLARDDVHFDDFRLCLHHPDGIVAELSGPCDCRKPAPGMLIAAAEALDLDLPASWMIGDTDADVIAGHAAGCRTILVEQPGSKHKRRGTVSSDQVVEDLAGAVDLILQDEGVH